MKGNCQWGRVGAIGAGGLPDDGAGFLIKCGDGVIAVSAGLANNQISDDQWRAAHAPIEVFSGWISSAGGLEDVYFPDFSTFCGGQAEELS